MSDFKQKNVISNNFCGLLALFFVIIQMYSILFIGINLIGKYSKN